MPSLSDKIETLEDNPPLLRQLFYGSPKTRKTWLAGTAATAGFNTILIDSDHGYHILLKNLPEEARKRLMIIEARDSLKRATAIEFMSRFLKFGNVIFNEETKEVVLASKLVDENCIELSLKKHLNSNTVLIIDSYTALVRSIAFRYAIENKIDLSDASKPDWDGYAWCGTLASWIVDKLTTLPCHIIVIGHKTVYEKKSSDGKKTEWTRTQLKSTSGPHSMTIGDKFSDILYFENASSSVTKISTRAEKDAEGVSRLIPPGSYNWQELQFDKICEYSGIKLPPKDLPVLDFSLEQHTEEKKDEQNSTVKTGQAQSAKIPNKLTGLSKLSKK